MKCFGHVNPPGSIAPVKATDDMTQPVGIRDSRLWTKPGGGGEITSGAGVAVIQSGSVSGSQTMPMLTINPGELPEGAVIDYVDIYMMVSGGTVPLKVTIYYTTSGLYSFNDGSGTGFAIWNASQYNNIRYYTATSNTLYSVNLAQSGNTITGGRVYYHI